jgi:signal transduction histidine kinase
MRMEEILIIDDNLDHRNAIQFLLEKEGYIVITANNGKTGFEILNEYEGIRIMIVDLAMLELSGVELLKMIKNRRQPLRRIVLTAYDGELSFTDAKELKVFSYLNKPITKHILLFTVKAAFNDLYIKEFEKELGIAKQWEELGQITADYVQRFRNKAENILDLVDLIKKDLTASTQQVQSKLEKIKEISDQIVEIKDVLLKPFDKVKCENVNLNKIIDLTIKSMRISKDINITKNYTIDKPEVKFNKMELKKVLKIIIENALDAMVNSKTKELLITTDELTRDIVQIKIQDTGIGIREDEWKNIFRPFYYQKEVRGSGLGLFTVKNTLAKYNSSITFASKIDKGTTFTIKIPLVQLFKEG